MTRRTLLLVVLLALLPYAWLTHRFDWQCDDAFISFRYASNLAEGHGLRYNVGEQPPVEGYSNFLWVLALTPFEALGWPSPAPSRLLSIACGVALLFRLAAFLARELGLEAPAVAVAVFFLATLPPVAMWSTSGLETMAFALLVFAGFETLGRPGRIPAALASCVGLILIRPEGLPWVCVLIALAALDARFGRPGLIGDWCESQPQARARGFSSDQDAKPQSYWSISRISQRRAGGKVPLAARPEFYTRLLENRSVLRPLIVTAAGSAAMAAVLLGFRLWYFGYPLPNTAYAKAGFSLLSVERGARYVGSYLLAFPHLALILCAGVALAITDRRRRRVLIRPLTLAAAFCAFAVVAGGDFMPMGRLLVPALPLLAVVLGVLAQRVAGRRLAVAGLAAAAIVCSLLPAFDRHPVPEGVRRQLHFRWNMNKFDSELQTWRRMRNRVAIGIDLAGALSEHTLPGESLPYGRIGALGYYSKLFIFDQNGLVNLEVARRPAPPHKPERGGPRRSAGHDKHVPRSYFLKHRPTYYRARIERSLPEAGRLEHIAELLQLDATPAVRAGYAPLFYPVDSAYGKFLILAKRKDLVPDGPMAGEPTADPR